MTRLRWLTAGESHGPMLVGILEGMPAGLALRAADIDADLARRQRGHGRGGRMKIEKDQARVVSGVRFARTLGSPIALVIENRDFSSWTDRMSVEGPETGARVTVPRPGHADLAAAMKYGYADLRDGLERASARETTMRVALAAICKRLCAEVGISVGSWVTAIGGVGAPEAETVDSELAARDAAALSLRADESPVRCLDAAASEAMISSFQRMAVDSPKDGRCARPQSPWRRDGKPAQHITGINGGWPVAEWVSLSKQFRVQPLGCIRLHIPAHKLKLEL